MDRVQQRQWRLLKSGKRRETWGRYKTQSGSLLTMIRGSRNQTWFENEQGRRVGPIQTNIAPAMCYADSRGWSHVTP